eukprot:COSAG04_NODE_9170_length_891_cov_1.614899_1_plen_209_part_00
MGGRQRLRGAENRGGRGPDGRGPGAAAGRGGDGAGAGAGARAAQGKKPESPLRAEPKQSSDHRSSRHRAAAQTSAGFFSEGGDALADEEDGGLGLKLGVRRHVLERRKPVPAAPTVCTLSRARSWKHRLSPPLTPGWRVLGRAKAGMGRGGGAYMSSTGRIFSLYVRLIPSCRPPEQRKSDKGLLRSAELLRRLRASGRSGSAPGRGR